MPVLPRRPLPRTITPLPSPGWLPIRVPPSIVILPHPIVPVGVPPHPGIPRVVEPPPAAIFVHHLFVLWSIGLGICLLRWCILHICFLPGCNLARGRILVSMGWCILAR